MTALSRLLKWGITQLSDITFVILSLTIGFSMTVIYFIESDDSIIPYWGGGMPHFQLVGFILVVLGTLGAAARSNDNALSITFVAAGVLGLFGGNDPWHPGMHTPLLWLTLSGATLIWYFKFANGYELRPAYQRVDQFRKVALFATLCAVIAVLAIYRNSTGLWAAIIAIVTMAVVVGLLEVGKPKNRAAGAPRRA